MYFAHSAATPDRSGWQRLSDHLIQVAGLAAERGEKFGMAKPAALAGLLHDLGKYTAAFQRRLEGGPRIDHATAGAKAVESLASGPDRGMAMLVAYAVAGHHGGMPDGQGGAGCLAERLAKPLEALDPVWREELMPDASGLLPERFQPHPDPCRRAFQLGLMGRMLFSCLVDADFRDTERFYAEAEGREVDRHWPALPAIAERLVAAFEAHMAEKRAGAPPSAVNRLREEVLAHVRAGAAAPPGLFSLTVPTGGGKTLASLGFALDHLRRHRLDRIVYAIPFTSVIDQTAAIFRDLFCDVGEDVVLEHHSAIDEERLEAREGGEKLRLAMEDWAAPVVITTNVQLFESLFANRPSRCRKLHNLARSVIILDEAQTIPRPVLRPCVAALGELARNYGSSIVLCTATQPALEEPNFKGGFAAGSLRELAPEPRRLHASLRRVRLRWAGEMADQDLLAELGEAPQGLVIVNSRVHALALYRQANGAGLEGLVHLTTRQHAAHRRDILRDVRARLSAGEPCRVVATSLVEAGVDVDFPRVWRAEAGLDQVHQAAGRCNREGRRNVEDSVVTVFRAAEHRPPREVAQLAGDLTRIAKNHSDLLSLEAMQDYFGEVYWRMAEGLDANNVLDAFRMDAAGLDFAYRSVAESFRLIESGLAPVIVAREHEHREKEACRAVQALASPKAHAGAIARRLQPFTVQVPPRARAALLANGQVRFVEERRVGTQFAVLSNDGLYHEEVGLLWENPDYLGLEKLMI